MENLISAQVELLEQIKKSLVNFKKTPRDRCTETYINIKLKILEQTWSSFYENHTSLLKTYDISTIKASKYTTEDIYSIAEEEYTLAKVAILEKLNTKKSTSSITAETSVHKSEARPVEVKIPILQISVFTGCYTEWYSFHDQFVSVIHQNSNLTNVQKLHYLKMYVTGEAGKLLKNIPITEQNYEHAWEKLKRRFSNKRVIVNAYLQKLMSIRNLNYESASLIKNLLDVTTDCLSGLNATDVSTDNWDAIIIYLTVNKLDGESLKQWEEQISKQGDDKLPTFEMLTNFLEARFRSLEGIQSSRTNNTRTRQTPVEKKVYLTNKTSNETCNYCNGDHYIHKCNQFAAITHAEKKNFIEQKKLCYNCLMPYHQIKECRNKIRCHTCGKKNHTLIHVNSPPVNNDKQNTQQTYVTRAAKQYVQSTERENRTHSEQDIVSHIATRQKTNILLATALVKIKSQGRTLQLRALIDQGSEGTFITESAAQALGLRRKAINCSISGIGDTQAVKTKYMVEFTLQSNIDEFNMNIEAYVLKSLTRLLPAKQIATSWQSLQGLTLADPTYGCPGKIDLLLGAAVYSRILLSGVLTGPPGTPLAQNTRLGWILSGEVTTDNCLKQNTVISMHISTTEENKLLRKFWEIESDEKCKPKKRMTEEEQQCEQIYESTYTIDEDGRYVVQIPFKDANYDYGNTRDIAQRRLEQLERRLNKDTELKQEYTRVLKEYKELGHMEEIDKNEIKKTTKEIFYLPHHPVVNKAKSTSQVRIVFDASMKGSKGQSLNENMLVGPTLQRDLRHIVMTWRNYQIAFVSDCIKMYRQIKVTDKCADLQRILWRDNAEIKEYRLTRVTFGTASAPYLATKTLQQLANNSKDNYPTASEIAKKDFYMDDLLSGGDNLYEAQQIYVQITEMMKSGGFEMQKWASNCKEFMEYVEREGNNSNSTYVLKDDNVVKTLGIRWDRTSDRFQYTVNLNHDSSDNPTKRTILSTVARLYDPMGWLTPVIIIAKTFIQKLWLAGLDWDQEIPKEMKEEWIFYRNSLADVKEISIQRWLNTNTDDQKRELHGYSDASTMAYAAVIYMRIIKKDGTIYTHLITAKSRVAPTKTISIPRLELCGALLLTNLLVEVAEQLDICQENINAYTDSKVVLAWLQSHPSRWKTFIANRTSEIISLLPSNHWHHVSSEDNPADVASRGSTPSQLLEHSSWWTGPQHLKHKTLEHKQLVENTTKLEEKTVRIMTITTNEEFNLFIRYSKLTRLLRVTAYILRIFDKEKPKQLHLTGEEIDRAMVKCILICQEQGYSEEIKQLREKKDIHNRSSLKSLNPFLDNNGILRVGGRLTHAHIPDGAKHQMILPGNMPFTKLILQDCHDKTLHGGPMLMLSHLRTRFWVSHAKSLLRKILHECVTCTRHRGSTASQMMGSLPAVRVTPARCFLNTGVDLAGPIDLRLSKGRGCKTQKGYIVIFICMVVRAIHIEVVTGLTAKDFIAAFKRFVARRGQCKNLYSDNATNFTAGNKELSSAFENSINEVEAEIQTLLANDGTSWHYIPASAPHFGGLWESGVRSIKFHLKRILSNTTLTYEEMTTVTSQIEATLNSRPISPMSDDPSDCTPLTPGHFLIGEAPLTVPEGNYLDSNINRLDRWQMTQRMFQNFWARWSKEYLARLQQRPKWTNAKPNIEVGNLVIIKDDNIPPGKWLLARVMETHPGKDNCTRVVTLKTKNSIFKRPVHKICLLPIPTSKEN